MQTIRGPGDQRPHFLGLTLEYSPECMILLQASEDQRSTIQIGEAAQLAKLGIDTIRFYERRALLPRARRTGGQFRLFTVDDVERLIFIKQIQGLGFSGSLYEKSSNCSTCGTEENMRAER